MIIQMSKLERVVIYIYCLFLTLPVISQIFPTIINMCIYIIIGGVILRRFKIIRVRNLILFMIGLFVVGLPIVIRQGITVKSLYQIYYNMLPLVVGTYLIIYSDKLFCKKILRLLLICIFITTITTIYGLTKNPTISRFLATGNIEFYELSKWGNIGGFEFIYGMVIFLICYVVLYKKKEINFWPFLVLYLSGIYCIVLSQYTLALLLSMLSLIIFVFSTSKFDIKRCVITCVLSLVVVFQKNVLTLILNGIKTIVNSEIVTMRLEYLLDSLNNANNQSDVSLRFDAYGKSWQAFKNNLFSLNFSSNLAEVGGHSTILDIMGIMGIIGVVALVIFYVFYWKELCKFKIRKTDKGYFLFIFIIVISLQIFNPFSITNYAFCVVIPLIFKKISYLEEVE